MASSATGDGLCILLLGLSALSFLPQILHTISRKNGTGLSILYLLFNLISTTEQLSLTFFFIVNHIDEPDIFVHSPINSGDWINLAQTTVVVILWVFLFIVTLHLPSEHRDISKKAAVGAYIAFLLISLLPLLADFIISSGREDRRWFGALYGGIHSLFISFIIIGLNIVAVFAQIREIRLRPSEQALRRLGLAVQAVVFALVAWSWIPRVAFPYGDIEHFSPGMLWTWYELVGWAAVDNAIFALGQALLFWITIRRMGNERRSLGDETTPLLRA